MNSTQLFPDSLAAKLAATKIVAVLMVDDAAAAVPLAKALLAGGVDVMELTLRTPAALAALREVKAHVPEMIAGIGTILTPEQVVAAKETGGAFGVAPGLNLRVLARAAEVGLPFAPGVCTPTEIEAAIEAGCRVLKFFPAESLGGIKTIATMTTPYAHLGIRYIPLGGLTQGNFTDYLAHPAILAVGGSWIATREEIQRRDWTSITAKATAATARLKKEH